MREIKFRGRRVDNGERAYGSLTICNAFDFKNGIHEPQPLRTIICKQDIEWISEPNNKRWTFPSYEIDPETVGMFTTLLDKNKKEIYGSIPIDGKMSKGGDIVKWDRSRMLAVIEWCVASFTMKVNTPKGIRNYSMLNSYDGIEADMILDEHEVIGNVTENPELLEKQK